MARRRWRSASRAVGHYHGRSLLLTATEARLAGELARRFGDVVPDADLVALLPGGERAVRNDMTRLRARLRTTGLQVSRIPRRGYQLTSR